MESDEGRTVALKQLNERLGGFDTAMGIRILRASMDEVVLEYEVGPQHLQPYGIVHGGLHCAAVETACSTGAGLTARKRGQAVVGIENHTSFIRAVRSGRIEVRATPITRGRRTQVWQAVALNQAGQIVSTGRVRLMCLDEGEELAGEPVRDA